MERPQCRSAAKVSNYRQYHLSGDLNEVVLGKVSETVHRLETNNSNVITDTMDEEAQNAELQDLTTEQKEKSLKMQMQVENMRLKNELEEHKLQQEQWEAAMQKLKEERDKMLEEHQRNMELIKAGPSETPTHKRSQSVTRLQQELQRQTSPLTKINEEQAERERLLEDLHKQQEELQRQIADITGAAQPHPLLGKPNLAHVPPPQLDQNLLMEQVRDVLSAKDAERDPNKVLLKALVTGANKTARAGGPTTLKHDVLDRLAMPNEFSMAEWLASLNKQEEGELDVSKYLNRDDEFNCRTECRHSKMRSGMLDKSTTNIRQRKSGLRRT